MHFDEKQLFEMTKKYRQAIDQTNFSSEAVGKEGFLRMRSFPEGACSEACTLFGIYLSEEFGIEPLIERCGQIEEGSAWYGSHHWLEHEEIIIDIAADQFPMVGEPVIVARISPFHDRYAKKRGIITTTFELKNEQNWMIVLYQAVHRTLLQNEIAKEAN